MAPRPIRILVVDDEPQIQRLLRTSLGAHDYDVEPALTGEEASRKLRAGVFDLVILDLGLPDKSGLELLEAARVTSSVPIIVLSARGDDDGKVTAFELGADDYVTKPFSMAELLARIKAALRHRYQERGTLPVVRCGELAIDLTTRAVTLAGKPISLTPIEYDLLSLLAEHQGKALTHSFLLKKVWGDGNSGDVQYLRVYIRSLRQKLQEHPGAPPVIQTELGVGYRMMAS
jgi:two-component system KDP operon response regulator KdpE